MKHLSNRSLTAAPQSTFVIQQTNRIVRSIGTLLLLLTAPAASFGGVRYEKIGDPEFEIVGHMAGSTPVSRSSIGSQAIWERTLDKIFGEPYLVKRGRNSGRASASVIPTILDPLGIPVAEHVRRSFAASGTINTDVFSVDEIFWDRSRLDLRILSPTNAAPIGVSLQDPNGPVIPNDIFPLTNAKNHHLFQNGRRVWGGPSSSIPSLDSRGSITGADGIQHDFSGLNYTDLIIPNAWSAGRGHSLNSLVGDWEIQYSVTDKNGNGWRVFETLTTVRRPTDILGDLNYNGEFDMHDLNILTQNVVIAPAEPHGDFLRRLDLNGDEAVDASDVVHWVTDLKSTWIGDANLDGEFNSSDFVDVFKSGKYETGELARWSEGDWNADELFDSSDFIAAFQDGG